jgi:hypothetical protein
MGKGKSKVKTQKCLGPAESALDRLIWRISLTPPELLTFAF